MKKHYLSAKLSNYPTYSEYRESGVSYIGKIPAQWSIQKVGREPLPELNHVLFNHLLNSFDMIAAQDEMYTVVPSVEEQQAMLVFIDNQLNKLHQIREAIDCTHTVDLVNSYTKNVIRDVITGKIDTRYVS